MRRLAIILALIAVAGCKRPEYPPEKPTERAGGVISQVKDRIDEHVVMEMLRDLHLHISTQESGGQMPSLDDVRNYAKKDNKKLGELIDKGAIVLPAKLNRGGLWGYYKEITTRGRWIIVQAGPIAVPEDEFNEWLAKSK